MSDDFGLTGMADDTFRRMASQTTRELTTALAEAQAEVARLRDALLSVCEYEPDELDDPLMVIVRMAGLARAALSPQAQEG